MAENPKSSGIGTGAAQVYDYSRIDRAMANAFNVVNQKKALSDKVRREEKAKTEEEIKNIKKELDYDPEGLMPKDKELLIGRVASMNKTFDGHWEDVLNGDPKWSNLYNKMANEIKKDISNSKDTFKYWQSLRDTMEQPDSGYSEEKRQQLYNMLGMEWGTIDDINASKVQKRNMFKDGKHPFQRTDSLINNEALYDVNVSSATNAQRGGYSVDEKVWNDERAREAIFTAVEKDLSLQNDLDILYDDDMSYEEKKEQYYNDYKKAKEEYRKKTEYIAAPEEKDSGAGAGGKRAFNTNVTTQSYKDAEGKTQKRDVLGTAKYSTGEPYKIRGGSFLDLNGEIISMDDAHVKGIWVKGGKIYGYISGKGYSLHDGRPSGKNEAYYDITNEEMQISKPDFMQMAAGLGINETYESFIKKMKNRAQINFNETPTDNQTQGLTGGTPR